MLIWEKLLITAKDYHSSYSTVTKFETLLIKFSIKNLYFISGLQQCAKRWLESGTHTQPRLVYTKNKVVMFSLKYCGSKGKKCLLLSFSVIRQAKLREIRYLFLPILYYFTNFPLNSNTFPKKVVELFSITLCNTDSTFCHSHYRVVCIQR